MKRTTNLLRALLISSLASVAAAGPPNVVLILSDDQAWTDYSFMGHDVIQTPHLDKLAKESVVFTRGYVPSSLCRPSLMTLATGLYPYQHKIVGNDPPSGTDRGAMLKHVESHPTLPRMLAEKGYLSLQTGKWWEGNYKLGGFTHGMTHGDPQRGGRHGDEGLKIGRQGLKPIFDFIEECGDRPFFVWYAPFLPHTPHNPPERLLNKYKDKVDSLHVARYYAMCEWFDETCGELVDYIDQKKLGENTLIVYVTDNGWIQNPAAANYAPKSKRSPYDGGIRTPIMVRWPGKLAPRRDEATLVSSIDLVPTILAACGLKPTADMPGLNLLDVVTDTATKRDAIFGEIFDHDVANIDEPAASLQYRWCIEGDWKLIVAKDGKQRELYNLKVDPHETKNLATDHPDLVERLVRRIDEWWRVP
jgi:arylsulfatase A-like enzyme